MFFVKMFRFFPNMGVGEKADLRDLLKTLDSHVQSHYSSYKNAFLQIDIVSMKESVCF